MARFDLSPLYRQSVGFDRFVNLVDSLTNVDGDGGGYPPYNIEQIGENAYRITVAVAGFSEGDLSITLEDRQLVVKGRQSDDAEGRTFLHRGIAARQFQRSFVLADGVEVSAASTENGLLHVDLIRQLPDAVVQNIAINKA